MAQSNRTSQPFSHGNEDWENQHRRLRDDDELWQRLQSAGVGYGLDGQLYEIRCCPGCGSHINREVNTRAALAELSRQAGIIQRSLDMLTASCR
jgi:hypothetical protein